MVPHECDPVVVVFLYSNGTGNYAPCVQSNPLVAAVAPVSERCPISMDRGAWRQRPSKNVAEDPGWKIMGLLVKGGRG